MAWMKDRKKRKTTWVRLRLTWAYHAPLFRDIALDKAFLSLKSRTQSTTPAFSMISARSGTPCFCFHDAPSLTTWRAIVSICRFKLVAPQPLSMIGTAPAGCEDPESVVGVRKESRLRSGSLCEENMGRQQSISPGPATPALRLGTNSRTCLVA